MRWESCRLEHKRDQKRVTHLVFVWKGWFDFSMNGSNLSAAAKWKTIILQVRFKGNVRLDTCPAQGFGHLGGKTGTIVCSGNVEITLCLAGPLLLSLTKPDIWVLEPLRVGVCEKFVFEQATPSISSLVNKSEQVRFGAYSGCVHKLASESSLLVLYSFTLSFSPCSSFPSYLSCDFVTQPST